MAKSLLVDDDPVMQQYTKKILEKAGHSVEIANDAPGAIDLAKANPYQIIIVDLVLPGFMNGIDVIKEIRKFNQDAKLIAYSGFCDEDINEKINRAGADHFLMKPFKPYELWELIKDVLEEDDEELKSTLKFLFA